jgi:cytochrome c oxidase assembly factor 6|uniref:Cytochrome c oxidase assembly factor 6 homolog n=1 Tax=Eutreptiella gymnastica TaxID=73025 RepID=A0A7S4LLI4_9EUGL
MSVVLYGFGPLLTNSGRSSRRKQCYESKDTFFKCLDKSKNDTDVCEMEGKSYSSDCPASWIRYFNEQRWKALELKGEVKPGSVKLPSSHFEGSEAKAK